MKRVALSEAPVGRITQAVLDANPQTVNDALDLGVALNPLRPFVGQGATLDVWEALATLASHDLALARAIEPHIDAQTILDQEASSHVRGGTWGVFASEGSGHRVEARESDTGWRLTGVKQWCSLGGSLSDALVTAWVSESERRLFRVKLSEHGVRVSSAEWHSRGLEEIPSNAVEFDESPATPVGATGWYLDRPGFAWGGISVAACWLGGATGLGRSLLEATRRPGGRGDDITLMHLGAVDARLAESRQAFAAAAAVLDSGDEAVVLGKRLRSTVARAAEGAMFHVGHALGPEPLVRDESHAKRVADLTVYIRQHHGERDDASLGRSVRDSDIEW